MNNLDRYAIGLICTKCEASMEGVFLPSMKCLKCGAPMEQWIPENEAHEREGK